MTETAIKTRSSSTKLPTRVHIQRNDGSVDFVSWDEAFALNQKGKSEFLSRTLFKAAKAGLDIKKLKGQSDKAVKELMRTKSKPEKAEKKVEVEAKAETKKEKRK